jgi:DNA-binding transcriptional LysR family regulator
MLIGFDRETASIRALRRLGLKLRREDFALRTDSHLVQLAAIRAGFGIGVCQTAIARRDCDIVPILPSDFAYDLEVRIAMHGDLRASRFQPPGRRPLGLCADEGTTPAMSGLGRLLRALIS